MNFNLIKKCCALFLVLSMFTGCSVVGSSKGNESTAGMKSEIVKYQVEPETFKLEVLKGGIAVPVSEAMESRKVENYIETGNKTKWSYPEENVTVSLEPKNGYLNVTITSQISKDNEFQWPKISGETYYMPLGEGKRIPAKDDAWVSYLRDQEFEVLEQLSMPFWASVHGDYAVSFILENPYRSTLNFSEGGSVNFILDHQYPAIDLNRENSFRIYVAENDPTVAAKYYRDYVIEKGDFVTLEEKAKDNSNIKKLYGAPHIYLAGDNVLSPEDVNWPAFRKALSTDAMKHVLTYASKLETGQEMVTTVKEISTQDYVSEYQKNAICRFISEVLKQEDFFNATVFSKQDSYMKSVLSKKKRDESSMIQLNKHALAANLSDVFKPVDTWMNSDTTTLIADLKKSGIEQAWIGLNNWEQAYSKPEMVKTAVKQGYLIGPYDSYHSIHKPGEEQWITAAFPDTSLYDDATIVKKNGEKAMGFQNVGRKLNPTLALPSVKERVKEIMGTGVQFNSWFIDCDATGEIYDDYSPEHKTTQQQDLEARLERMKWIRDQNQMVIGSEGGHDFAASTVAFAHGIELKSFSWMDEDMKKNKQSDYYIGSFYNPTGGAAEHFTKRVPVKEQLYKVFVDPKYDLPLFKLVYNESVITTYHWDWPTFKIVGAVQDRMLREVLYNVPPLYYLDGSEWNKYKEDITAHTKVWSEFSQQVITQEMTNFTDLTGDGSVQRCEYGDTVSVTANFSDAPYMDGGAEIPAHGLLLKTDGKSTIYIPQITAENQ